MNQNSAIAEEPKLNWISSTLDKSRVEFLVLDCQSDSELIKLFRSHPSWSVDFENKEAVLFARATSEQDGRLARLNRDYGD
jgi:hypothetical protein